jgi:DNA-binding XRE family transcriptional regulator
VLALPTPFSFWNYTPMYRETSIQNCHKYLSIAVFFDAMYSVREGGRSMTISTLGKRVLLRRRDLNLTQAELATQAKISANTIARLERGVVQDLRGSHIVRLADVLGVSADYLLGRDQEPQRVSETTRLSPPDTSHAARRLREN